MEQNSYCPDKHQTSIKFERHVSKDNKSKHVKVLGRNFAVQRSNLNSLKLLAAVMTVCTQSKLFKRINPSKNEYKSDK